MRAVGNVSRYAEIRVARDCFRRVVRPSESRRWIGRVASLLEIYPEDHSVGSATFYRYRIRRDEKLKESEKLRRSNLLFGRRTR